jgi:hypothetical protein
LKKIFDPIFGFPTFVRFCWSTAKVIIEDKAVNCEWEEDDGTNDQWNEDDDDELTDNNSKKKKPVKSAPITNFFKIEDKGNPRKKLKVQEEPVFFLDRHLTRVTSIQEFL